MIKKGCIFRAFKKFSLKDNFEYTCIYPTTHDAIISILRKNKLDVKLLDLQRRRRSSIKITDDDPHMKQLYAKRKFSTVYDDITGIDSTNKVNAEQETVDFKV